jgi:hypothetical protein
METTAWVQADRAHVAGLSVQETLYELWVLQPWLVSQLRSMGDHKGVAECLLAARETESVTARVALREKVAYSGSSEAVPKELCSADPLRQAFLAGWVMASIGHRLIALPHLEEQDARAGLRFDEAIALLGEVPRQTVKAGDVGRVPELDVLLLHGYDAGDADFLDEDDRAGSRSRFGEYSLEWRSSDDRVRLVCPGGGEVLSPVVLIGATREGVQWRVTNAGMVNRPHPLHGVVSLQIEEDVGTWLLHCLEEIEARRGDD